MFPAFTENDTGRVGRAIEKGSGGVKQVSIQTKARTQFIDITHIVAEAVRESGIHSGVCTVFVPHTTAAVTINENADRDVMKDLQMETEKIVPWEDGYHHREGNSAAHIKASLFGASEQVLVENGKLCLGTWQGIYFCEFDGPRHRQVWIQVLASR